MVCAANVHMAMEAHNSSEFRESVNSSDLTVPDGMPIVWALRGLGYGQQHRVRVTPDLIIELLTECERTGLKIGLYGGSATTLPAFLSLLNATLPQLDVAYAWNPPYRPLSDEEDDEVVRMIAAAGVQLLLVGIGCPKQERWMHLHTNRVGCVMIGVGAAFDMFAGKTHDAPQWMVERGLEWLFRLSEDPHRLWRRHVFNDPKFLLLFARQLWRRRLVAQGGRI
jgi:N-acetylglucosaminyldiphosphoundecaprenol N-acetyl-beta-D-mannosaminyltransferase